MRAIWSHSRNITALMFENKLVYDIPVYSETIPKAFTYKVEYIDSCKILKLTIAPEPVELRSEASSCNNLRGLKVQPGESDKCFPSHQLPSHKMMCDSYALSTTSSLLS